jgi:hypothetical protein
VKLLIKHKKIGSWLIAISDRPEIPLHLWVG